MLVRLLAPAFLPLAACVAPISVDRVEPVPPPGLHTSVPAGIDAGDPAAVLGAHLVAIRNCLPRVESGDPRAIAEYNHRVARIIDTLDRSGLRPWEIPAPLDHPGLRPLTGSLPQGVRITSRETLIATDSLRFRGEFARFPRPRPGLGTTLISHRRLEPGQSAASQRHIAARTLTAIVRFEGSRPHLAILDPYQTENISLGSRSFPMAADFTANTSLTLSATRIDKLGLTRLLHPDRFDDTAAIQRIQPYDPERIPVLFVHGLQDTPASFAPMYFQLMTDPDIRRRFQFWVFTYPSGYPYPWSGALLRRELDRMNREYPGHKDIVIVGHSMGGLLARLMVTDADDRIWRRIFGKPPANTPLYGRSRRLLEDSLVFRSRDDIARAVFICAPHQGSTLASSWIGRTASRLVRLPTFLADSRDSVIGILQSDRSGAALDRAPNSIDTLAPGNAFIRAIAREPLSARVPFHSIMGDRGRGDGPDSSDGVVDYWSSHLPGAASEAVIPSDHSGHMHPAGIEEVRRILRSHLGLTGSAQKEMAPIGFVDRRRRQPLAPPNRR